jgi:hypothetical protein
MDDVRVHYNSPKPAQLQALAYTQGTDIHVAPGQEKHLPHEAWHVVQQKQGRVQPTVPLQGVNVNDDAGLEKEADVMGEVIQQRCAQSTIQLQEVNINDAERSEREVDIFTEYGDITQGKQYLSNNSGYLSVIQCCKHCGQTPCDDDCPYKDIYDYKVLDEEAKGYSIILNSETIDPYTSEEIPHLVDLDEYKAGELIYVNPFKLRTMHTGISDTFSDGTSILDLVEELKRGTINIDQLPPIKVCVIYLKRRPWEREDLLESRNSLELTIFTEDHRRVVAARLANKKRMKAQIQVDPRVKGKYTTTNRGMSIELRHYVDIERGLHQRENKSTFPNGSMVFVPEAGP